ncbi:MAG: hypothetical protein K2G30_09695, partial [Muribaculaceae bacterium]|nr:hypothetical protein [Muribaculaceae bacterium]
LHAHEEIKKVPGVKVIGHVTALSLGCAMVTRDGGEIPIRAQGWNALVSDAPVSPDAASDAPADAAGEETAGDAAAPSDR